jgi:hypothetical protein
MGFSEQFGAEDWARIVAAPMAAGLAVTAAEPGGLWGALRESFAVGGAFREAKAGGTGGLIGEIVAAYESAEGRTRVQETLAGHFKGRPAAEAAKAAVAEIGAVAALVSARAPAEAAAFKSWIAGVAAKVAEAGTEGGFLGFGGVKVSAAEKATLAEIDRALG